VRPVMSEDTVFGLLQRVPLFAGLPPADLRAVARDSRHVVKQKSATIFEEGSPADSCYVITSGRAKVVLSGRAGTEVILGTVESLELVGELSLLDSRPRSAGLVALEDCQLLWLPKASFLQLRGNRAFEDRLVVHVSSMLRRATEQLRATRTYKAEERVSWCLARLALRNGQPAGGAIVISPKPSDQELADMSGCARETVNRVMKKLQRALWVSGDRKGLTLNANNFKRYLEIERAAGNGPETTRII
jgi:CRP/FNR family transcriptional regulator, cyclic AMP receptor protein